MAVGWAVQLAKQAGEYFVAAELCRRGYLATTFAGAVPHYDIVALDAGGKAATIQVKTVLGGDWQISDARKLVDIDGPDERLVQTVRGPIVVASACDAWVFVSLKGEVPSYFVASFLEVQELVAARYASYLTKHDGVRPGNPRSFHHAIRLNDLQEWRDRWSLVSEIIAARS